MKYFLALTVYLASLLVALPAATSSANAQENPLIPLHLFKNRKQEPITCGRLTRLTDDEVKIIDGLGSTHTVLIKDLHRNDQKFVKSIRTQASLFQKQKLDSEKLIQQLDSNSKSLKQSTLEKLASLGVAAASQANTIAVFASKENDLSLAQNAMSTYLAICPKNARTFQVFLSIAKENRKLYLQIRNSPATFLEDLSKFGVVAEKLLIQISYSGRLAFSINREIAPLSKPDLFTTTHGTKNKIRAMAAGSLAQIPTAPANQAVLEIVKTASIPINQQIDLITISQILNGLAKAARPTITFKDIFNYESRFPREFKKWKNAYEQVKEYNKIHFLEQQFLIRCSKMHNFYDRNGKFLTRGNVEVLEDQRVLVIDADNRRQAFDRSRLSTRDQEWLQSNN